MSVNSINWSYTQFRWIDLPIPYRMGVLVSEGIAMQNMEHNFLVCRSTMEITSRIEMHLPLESVQSLQSYESTINGAIAHQKLIPKLVSSRVKSIAMTGIPKMPD